MSATSIWSQYINFLLLTIILFFQEISMIVQDMNFHGLLTRGQKINESGKPGVRAETT